MVFKVASFSKCPTALVAGVRSLAHVNSAHVPIEVAAAPESLAALLAFVRFALKCGKTRFMSKVRPSSLVYSETCFGTIVIRTVDRTDRKASFAAAILLIIVSYIVYS